MLLDNEEKNQLDNALTIQYEKELAKIQAELESCKEELVEVRRRLEKELNRGEVKDAKKELRLERRVWNNERDEFKKDRSLGGNHQCFFLKLNLIIIKETSPIY